MFTKTSFLSLLLLCLGTNLFGQSQEDELVFAMVIDSSVIDTSYCETARNIARRDIKDGRYAAFFHGYKSGFSSTFERLMFRKYGVYAVRTGYCLGDEFLSCYTEISEPAIREKFGADIFERTMEEASVLDAAGKGDRRAFYSEGWQAWMNFFYCSLDDERLKKYPSRRNHPTPTVTLKIDAMGNVFSIEVEFCNDKLVVEEIKRVGFSLPRLNPATRDGEFVEDSFIIGVNFHRKYKRRACR